ncbi:uncharacterized protein QC761_0024220 [Podospora bellae-mahoneyi]|uniref:FAD/NAD(P)-binding domain-containing protein n=1 Tax=Podospora bellae-mahoneyi TaxID=2093777 RepID=A0ABR0G1U5_9PEZI|nr:hypothetical protein QC761_0024220 [Podospora bellae-mahoneyi]
MPYDKLVLALGAEPITPSGIQGGDSKHVFHLTTLGDLDSIKEYIKSHAVRTVAVIGGAFIGLEAAENLRLLGREVSGIERLSHISQRAKGSTHQLLSLSQVSYIRLYTRLRATRRLFWDDTVLILGTIFVVAASALWQWAAPKFWFMLAVGSGTAFPTDLEQFMKDVEITMRVFFVEQVFFFFYSTLAGVKLSLLLFFRRIGWHMTNIRVAWWSVLALVVATQLTSIGDSQWGCLVAMGFDIMTQCTEPPAIRYANLTLRINSVPWMWCLMLRYYLSPSF